jgi:hypothetical protein
MAITREELRRIGFTEAHINQRLAEGMTLVEILDMDAPNYRRQVSK